MGTLFEQPPQDYRRVESEHAIQLIEEIEKVLQRNEVEVYFEIVHKCQMRGSD